MKIVLNPSQYMRLLVYEQATIDGLPKKDKLEIKYTNFRPDTKWKKEYVYINGVDDEDVDVLEELKKDNLDYDIILKNVLTKETFTFPIENVRLTQKKKPYISIEEYKKIESELEKHEMKLNKEFLKKSVSGIPKFISEVLRKVYPQNIGRNSFISGGGLCNSEEGLINIEGTNVPGQTWSILNFFDTNPRVIQQLIDWYHVDYFKNKEIDEVENIANFKNWIEKNSQNIFKGEKLKILVKYNLESYTNGMKNEMEVIDHLTKPPFNFKMTEIKQFCAGSTEDIREGKDLEVKTKNGLKYLQSKPLSWIKYNDETGEYVIGTYFMKNYIGKKVDYIVFATKKELYIFPNKNYKVLNNHTVVFNTPPVDTI